MAVYSKLLLSAGGGIVSTTQQAEQVKDTATVLIGLGGTGIDALRTIKTQVYSRLKADDPDAVVRTYKHIRFLGVDTAEKSRGDTKDQDDVKAGALMALDDTEFFSISNSNVKKAFSNIEAMKMRDELSWLRWEDIDVPDLGKAGAGSLQDGAHIFAALLGLRGDALRDGAVGGVHRDLAGGEHKTACAVALRVGPNGTGSLFGADDVHGNSPLFSNNRNGPART